MSNIANGTIRCSECNKEYETSLNTSVNSKVNPELRIQIIKGIFFQKECVFCKHKNEVSYEVLYHDMESRFLVWLVKPDRRNYIYMQEYSLQLGLHAFNGYRFYIARSPLHWVERILTAEHNINPKILELYKFGLKEQLGFPLVTENDFLYFEGISKNIFGKTCYDWKIIYDNGDIKKLSRKVNKNKLNAYEKLLSSVTKPNKGSKWELIDWQYPFGLAVRDGELIELAKTSNFIEFGENRIKLPSQFLEVASHI